MAAPPPGDAQPGAEHVEIYPPPPPHYRLFAPDAPHPPPPPPPVIPPGEFEVFGELCSTDTAMPGLQGRPMFATAADGTLDFRAALTSILHELLFAYVELTDALARRPAAGWARAAEAVGAAARNAAHLLNALRPAQARASAAALLRADAERANRVADEVLEAVRGFDAACLNAGKAVGGG